MFTLTYEDGTGAPVSEDFASFDAAAKRGLAVSEAGETRVWLWEMPDGRGRTFRHMLVPIDGKMEWVRGEAAHTKTHELTLSAQRAARRLLNGDRL